MGYSHAWNGKYGNLMLSSAREEFGDLPEEVDGQLDGLTEWKFDEEADVAKYVDNMTGHRYARLANAIDMTGTATVNLQRSATGTTQGSLPVRAGEEYYFQFHVDNSGENYWDGIVMIESVGNFTVSKGSPDPVAVEISWGSQGGLTPHGSCAAIYPKSEPGNGGTA